MSGKPILYEMDIVPGVRAVKMTAHLIGLDLELRTVNLFAGEHLKEEFVKINPQHTVPTLEDNGKGIWESSVICTYLIDKYAKDDSLYPKDLYERAKCNQRLHFTDAILYQKLRNCSMNYYLGGTEVPEKDINALHDALKIFEAFVTSDPYLVGDRLTVADLCALSLITGYDEIYLPIEASTYPKTREWLDRMKSSPFYDTLEAPYVKKYKQLLADMIIKNKSEQKQ